MGGMARILRQGIDSARFSSDSACCRITIIMENHGCSLPELAIETLAQHSAIAQPIRHPAGRSAAHSAALARLRMNTRRAGWVAATSAAGAGSGAATGAGAAGTGAGLRPSPKSLAIFERMAA